MFSALQNTQSKFILGIKDQPQMAFNIGVHPSLLKVTNDSQDQYDSNDLIRIVILECIEITKLLLDDENYQKQGIDPAKLTETGLIDISWLQDKEDDWWNDISGLEQLQQHVVSFKTYLSKSEYQLLESTGFKPKDAQQDTEMVLERENAIKLEQ